MAKNSIRDFSATAGSNTDIQSVNIDENCPASGINNAIRELMVDLKNVSTGAINLETPAADSLTVAGDLTVDTNTLKVDSSNNRVGIGTDAPAHNVEIVATAAGSVNDSLQIRNNATSSGTGSRIRFINSTDNTSDANGASISSVRNGDDNDLVFETENATRMTIDHAGNVGIGTSSPSQKLSIVESGGSARMELLSGTSGTSIIDMGDTGDADIGGIRYNNSNNTMAIRVNNDERLSIGSDGLATRNGSASTASYGFINDTSTGMFLAANGKLAFTTEGTERMRLVNQNGGDLNFGGMSTFSFGNTETQINKFQINSGRNTTSARTHMAFGNPNGQVGSITTNGSSTAFETSSDHRLKQGVEDMTGAIDRVKALAPKRFQFIADADTTVDGFLAHEAQAVVPEAVSGTKDEVDDDGNPVMQGIDQSKLVPLLTAALKESIAKIETLETEMTALKARVTALEA